MHIYCKQFSCQVLVSTRKQIAFIENWLDLREGCDSHFYYPLIPCWIWIAELSFNLINDLIFLFWFWFWNVMHLLYFMWGCLLPILYVHIIAGSVAGPVIKANGRLTFEDDLRSGGLLCFTTQQTSVWVCQQYDNSGRSQRWHGVERCQLCL